MRRMKDYLINGGPGIRHGLQSREVATVTFDHYNVHIPAGPTTPALYAAESGQLQRGE